MIDFPEPHLNKNEKAAVLDGLNNWVIDDYMNAFASQCPTKWGGVKSNDSFKESKPQKDTVYILNLQNSSQPGSHWVLLWVDSNNKGYYFDPYGIKPTKSISKFVHIWDDRPFQSYESNACAYFCMYVASNILQGFSPTHRLKAGDQAYNERILQNYFVE